MTQQPKHTISVGKLVGDFEGDSDGADVGLNDGDLLGLNDGELVGLADGLAVEGALVGCEVEGAFVGWDVGLAVEVVGDWDGVSVGDS